MHLFYIVLAGDVTVAYLLGGEAGQLVSLLESPEPDVATE